MMPSLAALLLIAVVVSLVAAIGIVVSASRPNLREAWTIGAATVKIAAIAPLVPHVLAGQQPEVTLFSLTPAISLGLRADAAGVVFALSAATLWLLTSFFSIGYVRGLGEHRQTRYFASFAICLSATVGLAFAANLFTFFIFYELLTVSTYPLVVHKESPEALRAGRRYLAYLLSGGVALLLALAVLHQAVGDLDFRPGGFVAGQLTNSQVVVVFLLLALGFGTKSAIMPLHAWLPAAMVAPTPVSALLHAVAVVKAGVFGFARGIGYVLGVDVLAAVGATTLLAALAATTIVVASVVALGQDNLKRRLAFSTIAHLSYIVLGLSLVSATAWNGAMLHIVNHAALKITLFFCAGAIYVKTHREQVSQLDGVGRQMPFTMAAFGLASLGLAGVPPLGGFVSKWFLALGAIEGDQTVFAVVLLGSGLLTAGYLFPIVYRAFFRPPAGAGGRAEASPLLVGPLTATAVLALLLGLSDLFGMHALASGVAQAVTGVGL